MTVLIVLFILIPACIIASFFHDPAVTYDE
jgi:hypothetical protein